MMIKLELEAETALNLCALHTIVMEQAVLNIGTHPLEYSSAAKITNDFFNEVVRRIPIEELDRLQRL